MRRYRVRREQSFSSSSYNLGTCAQSPAFAGLCAFLPLNKEFEMSSTPSCGALGCAADTTELAILALAEDILRGRLERQGSISDPVDAIDYLRLRLGALEHEEFHVLWLDNRHHILQCQCLFTGTIDGAAIYPREVVRAALTVNASAAILAHNHPSGIAEPSGADKAITRELREALKLIGVRVLDHIIVGADCASFAKLGLL
jgi:DNA repair protein RadC